MIRPSIISSKNDVVVETSQRAILPCRAIGKPKVRHRKSHQYYILRNHIILPTANYNNEFIQSLVMK